MRMGGGGHELKILLSSVGVGFFEFVNWCCVFCEERNEFHNRSRSLVTLDCVLCHVTMICVSFA